MKKLKYRMIDVVTILISIIIGILMYLPIYNDVAILPGYDLDGHEVVTKVVYEKTPLERLELIHLDWLLYVVFTFVGVGFILFIVSLFVKSQRLNKVKHIVLVGSVIFLVLLLGIAFIQFAKY